MKMTITTTTLILLLLPLLLLLLMFITIKMTEMTTTTTTATATPPLTSTIHFSLRNSPTDGGWDGAALSSDCVHYRPRSCAVSGKPHHRHADGVGAVPRS